MAYKIKIKWKKGISPKDNFHPVKNVYVSDGFINNKEEQIVISKYTNKKSSPYWVSKINKKNKVVKEYPANSRKKALKVAESYKKG
jgi:hypothetical protein